VAEESSSFVGVVVPVEEELVASKKSAPLDM